MEKRVLVIGGRGRIGSCVLADLMAHTSANMVITGRKPNSNLFLTEQFSTDHDRSRVSYITLDLLEYEKLKTVIAQSDLVVHCAGPFRQRDTWILQSCIENRVSYIDVSDDRTFTQKALSLHEMAIASGVTAVINSGVFPGISNSMVRQGVEQLDTVRKIHLSYVVGGSGGAGVTVMRTTFLSLQQPFEAWIEGRWQSVNPYTDREIIEFQAPFGRAGVYWFDMPESFTLVNSFPVETVITKFGSVPDFYNHLTWIVAHWFPAQLMQNPRAIEFLAQISHRMTGISDRFSGTGVAVRSEITGEKEGRSVRQCSNFIHESAAVATGQGTGSIAQCILSGQLVKPGVWAVEQALSTELFEEMMRSRGLAINQAWL
ncbi:MAG: saccharopine dehydrogenase NADP-binding domain-containing protein [Timaviella obliquedivisa GSE-PSE-MK23-08B]|jgi:saccharopine dehydrogenase-like NADP-dependent oxidoreductase|nr:saccharopine dehydrogenase NADP-binding domain-containing protein [Timaviella obliquedivisa GSE-PSE-MK23-08B]